MRPKSTGPMGPRARTRRRASRKSASSTIGATSPSTTSRHIAASSRRERLPRIASHSASAVGSGDAERGQTIGDRRIRHAMQRARRKRLKLRFVEARRAVREMRRIDQARQFVERIDGTHRLGRADQDRERGDRERLDALRPQRGDRQRPGALRKPPAAGVGQEVVMAEVGAQLRRGPRKSESAPPCW